MAVYTAARANVAGSTLTLPPRRPQAAPSTSAAVTSEGGTAVHLPWFIVAAAGTAEVHADDGALSV